MAEEFDAREDQEETRPEVIIPDEFKDAEEFLRHIRDLYAADEEAENENRDAAREDFKFLTGEQWGDDGLYERRINSGLPALTFNQLPAFVGQILGARRVNEASVKIVPSDSGDPDVAEVRTGIIRAIERQSRAQHVYNTAHLNQVVGGEGNFQIALEFTENDVFTQDIKIQAIPNPFAVLWDRNSLDPTGKDARHCFVVDYITQDDFKEFYPDEVPADFGGSGGNITDGMRHSGWFKDGDVRIAAYWRMVTEVRTLALMADDGHVEDVTDEPRESYIQRVAINQQTGLPYIRRAPRSFAEMYLVSGHAVLEGPYRLPIPRLPVFRAMGWEVFVGEERRRWGLVRFLKDPQRMYNYWRSVIAENLMKQPKATWLAGQSAVEGHETSFRDSADSDDPLLVYNDEAGAAPVRVPPAQIDSALITEAGTVQQELKSISNIHEANLGQVSNEVSGRALVARQQISELGALLYQSNLNDAIEECGKVINALMGFVYDTTRTLKVVDQDGNQESVTVNGAGGPDITAGKYDVVVTTGPSFATRKQEARESILAFINAAPQTAAVVSDLLAEAQDWPKADKIAERLKKTLPPGIIPLDEMTPEQQQAAQQAAQVQQAQQEIQQRTALADIRMKEAQAADFEARAQQAAANAMQSIAEIDIDRLKTVTEADNEQVRVVLEALKTIHEISNQGNPDDR